MIAMFAISSLVGCLLRPIDVPDRLRAWEPTVRWEACHQGISPKLVLSVMDVESAGKWNAKNAAATGLMQIKLATARVLGYRGSRWALMNPGINIHYGVAYLSRLMKRYTYGWDAISAYNCGRPHWSKGRGFMCLGHKTTYVKQVAYRFRHFGAKHKPSGRILVKLAYYKPFSGIVPQ